MANEALHVLCTELVRMSERAAEHVDARQWKDARDVSRSLLSISSRLHARLLALVEALELGAE